MSMAARAMWKGVIRVGKIEVPVKLYSAAREHTIHFRLLHEKDKTPVRQKMVNPATGEEVPSEETRLAFPLGRGRFVILEEEELAELQPESSRDIEISRFVKRGELDHRWYSRPYHLGPDANSAAYFALAEALEREGREGIARWVMRKKSYIGSLRAEDGYLALIVLRHADEVIDAERLPRPSGRPLAKNEVRMAEQLVSALAGPFEPEKFRDEYRERVMDLIETKAKGGKVTVKKFRPKPTTDKSLDRVLEASLASVKKRSA